MSPLLRHELLELFPLSNVTAIPDLLDPAGSRTYAYQDVQSFLTQAAGPWGSRSWTYDEIGNRLTESADGLTDTYAYTTNGDGGHTPLLSEVQLAAGGSRLYTYGPAGHLEEVNAGGNQVLFTSDDAGRLARLERPAPQIATLLRCDGRGFLAEAREKGTLLFADGFESGDLSCWSTVAGGEPGNPANCSAPPATQPATTEPLYSSEGFLHALFHTEGIAPLQSRYLFHLAGRPVAQLTTQDGIPDTWLYLTTDHLGTPVATTDAAGALTWQGGFEPFGEDWHAGTPTGAGENGLPLRLPGQWWDETWQEASLGVGVYYNVWRWLETGTGRYTRPDPLRVEAAFNTYLYADANPARYIDLLGLVWTEAQCGCCPPEEEMRELRQIGNFFRSDGRNYRKRWLQLTYGCGDAADQAVVDVESVVAPKCWITRTQMLASPGLGVGLALNTVS